VTTYQLDAAGRPVAINQQPTTDGNGAAGFNATADGPGRTWSFSYDAQGHVTSSKSPRADANGTTVYGYDGSGNLVSIADPDGLTTTLGSYDADGRPGLVTEPTGLQTSVSYDARGRVIQVNRGGAITAYAYAANGLMTSASLPSGVTVSFGYDAANRLVSESDSLGNQRLLTLDAVGNVLKETVTGNGGALAFSRSLVYDQLSRVTSITKPL
jgi:YD repeat-containing protein